jgi:hypothetical protein
VTDERRPPPRVDVQPRRPKDCRSAGRHGGVGGFVAGTLGGALVSVLLSPFAAEVLDRSDFQGIGLPWIAMPWGGGLGFLFARFMERSERRAASAREARVRSHREAPWLADNVWEPAGTSIRHAGARRRIRRREWLPLPLAVAALAFTIPFGSIFPEHLPYYVFGILGAVVVWMIWMTASRATLGRSHLAFARFPFHPGERVELTFGLDEGAASFEAVRYVLRRYEERPHGWQDLSVRCHVTFETEFSAEDGVLPGPENFVQLRFDVPPDAPGTFLSADWPSYWELEVAGETSRGPYRVMFLVPVYEKPDPPEPPPT